MKAVDFGAILQHCVLCPRQCGVNRLKGERGFCGAGRDAEIFRFAPHYGEEPPLSGTNGSGTIFFSRCTLGCIYCQNHPWSQEGQGSKITVKKLAVCLRDLRDRGCHNWNLVSPTPWLPMILEAVNELKAQGLALPLVYNTSGYERVEVLRALAGAVAVYLADLRYAREATAARASLAGNYVKKARAALQEMWRQAGGLRLDENGLAVSGLICRILILPDLANEACENIRWLAENIGPTVALSVMAQYTPAFKAREMKAWNRRISYAEYKQVRRTVEKYGFANGWVQDYDDHSSLELVGYNMPAMLENADLSAIAPIEDRRATAEGRI